MRFHYSASALALLTSSVLAQVCPPGFKHGTLKWENCPQTDMPTLQCAELPVPLDYANPAGDVLTLKLVRVPASGPNPQNKTVIYNPGGPGSPGISVFIEDGYGLNLQEDVTGTNFNLLAFDPRGTGLSIPFECPYVSRPVDSKNTDSKLQTLLNTLTTQSNNCAQKIYKDDNVLMGTAYVANDIKSIAAALGEDGLIRYLGYSYGTLLGATTAAMFPDYIDRMLLDGNINPTDYYYGLGEEAVADVDKSVARFFELCAAALPSECALMVTNQTASQLQQTFDTFLSTVTPDQSYVIRAYLQDKLYRPFNFPSVAQKIKSFYDKPSSVPSSWIQDDQNIAKRDDDDDWAPTDSGEVNTPMALQGITCADWIVRPKGSLSNFKSWLNIWQSTSKYSGDGVLLTTLYQCSLWQNDALEKFSMPFSGIKTKTPIFFANSQYDPVTPLISAQNSSSGFIGSRVFVTSGSGHCTTNNPSRELYGVMRSYFADGTFPAEDKIYTPNTPNWFVALRPDTANTTSATPASNSTIATSKKRRDVVDLSIPISMNKVRNVDYPAFFKNRPSIIRRQQSTIPIGCVAINSTSSSNSTLPGTPYSNSTRSGSYVQPGYPTTKVSGYNAYSAASGYPTGPNSYPVSKPSSKAGPKPCTTTPVPYGYAPVTKTITTTTCSTVTACANGGYCQIGQVVTKTITLTKVENKPTSKPITNPVTKTITKTTSSTVTACPNGSYCQIGQVITKTITRTTVVNGNKPTSVAKTAKSAKSSAPGQGYSVAKTTTKAYVLSVPSSVPVPVYGASTKPATPAAASTYSAKSAVIGTPTNGYPAQFTGAASTDHPLLSFLAAFFGFTLFAFNL